MSKFYDECAKYEKYIEGKNNDNMFGKYYGLNNQPYCGLGLSFCAEKVGNKFFQNIKDKTGKYFLAGCTSKYAAYCPSIYTYAKARGILKTDPSKNTPKKGDVVLFSFGKYKDNIRWSDHVAVIESYNPLTKKFKTLEFNTSNTNRLTNDGGGVFKKDRHISLITGYFSIE